MKVIIRSFAGGVLRSEEAKEVTLFGLEDLMPDINKRYAQKIHDGECEVLEVDFPDDPSDIFWLATDPTGLLIHLRPDPTQRFATSRFLAIKPEPLCHCGRLLHYTDPATRAGVEAFVRDLGPDVRVFISGRSWLVPRHYIALHGLKGKDEMETLGFPEVTA